MKAEKRGIKTFNRAFEPNSKCSPFALANIFSVENEVSDEKKVRPPCM